MLKKFIMLFSIIVFSILILFSISYKKYDISQYDLICKYVKENEDLLRQNINVIKEKDFNEDGFKIKDLIKNLPKGIKIDGIYKYTDKTTEAYIEFTVNEGFVSNSHYYGFYYSFDNKPQVVMSMPGEITKYDNGFKVSKEEKEDYYYTEKIVDNIYFYEAHY